MKVFLMTYFCESTNSKKILYFNYNFSGKEQEAMESSYVHVLRIGFQRAR